MDKGDPEYETRSPDTESETTPAENGDGSESSAPGIESGYHTRIRKQRTIQGAIPWDSINI